MRIIKGNFEGIRILIVFIFTKEYKNMLYSTIKNLHAISNDVNIYRYKEYNVIVLNMQSSVVLKSFIVPTFRSAHRLLLIFYRIRCRHAITYQPVLLIAGLEETFLATLSCYFPLIFDLSKIQLCYPCRGLYNPIFSFLYDKGPR